MTPARAAAVCLCAAALGAGALVAGGCAWQRAQSFESVAASPNPPEDFWLSVTVLKAPADTASRAAAYQRIPVAMRPARYIVEADRVLRVATGSGASDATFPMRTRQLSEAEFASLWNRLRGSSLVMADHPAAVGAAPTPAQIGERTVYVVSFAAGDNKRTLAIDAEPEAGAGVETGGAGAADARLLVGELAALAWMK